MFQCIVTKAIYFNARNPLSFETTKINASYRFKGQNMNNK